MDETYVKSLMNRFGEIFHDVAFTTARDTAVLAYIKIFKLAPAAGGWSMEQDVLLPRLVEKTVLEVKWHATGITKLKSCMGFAIPAAMGNGYKDVLLTVMGMSPEAFTSMSTPVKASKRQGLICHKANIVVPNDSEGLKRQVSAMEVFADSSKAEKFHATILDQDAKSSATMTKTQASLLSREEIDGKKKAILILQDWNEGQRDAINIAKNFLGRFSIIEGYLGSGILLCSSHS